MLKKDTLGTAATSKSLTEAFRCGECLHFKNSCHPSFEKPCGNNGVKPFAIAPKCYSPNVAELLDSNSDNFAILANLMNSFSTRQKRILQGLLRSQTQLKKTPFTFGTKVYFLLGKDYLSNYICGYVLGIATSGDVMVVGDPDKKTRGKNCVSYLSAESLMTYSQFSTHRKNLISSGRINDPAAFKPIRRTRVLDEYEPPNMDTIPSSWWNGSTEDSKKKKKTARSFKVDMGQK